MNKNKKAQFYLMGSVILIGILLGYLEISNSYQSTNFDEMYFSGEEIEVECQKILEHLTYQDVMTNSQKLSRLENFSEVYSKYSYLDNAYFIFGNSDEAVVSGYRKNSDGSMIVGCGSDLSTVGIQEDIFTTETCSSVNNINVTIDDITNEFEIKEGMNLYFILREEDEKGGMYIFTGSTIRNEENQF